jgi:hypothetical protein
MPGIASEPVVRLVLTGVVCLVPTVAFLGLLRLLDRLRNDVLVEHTMRMAAEEGGTSRLAGTRLDPAVALEADGPSESAESPASDWSDPQQAPRLVLCAACATLRPSRSGACPTCGAPLPQDRSKEDPEERSQGDDGEAAPANVDDGDR